MVLDLAELQETMITYWSQGSPYPKVLVPYVLGICTPWLTRHFRMPKLEIVRCEQAAREADFRFWHIVIKMKRPLFFSFQR
jgi:hypothetical protein